MNNKTKLMSWLLLTVLLLLMAGCGRNDNSSVPDSGSKAESPYSIQYAKCFSIEYLADQVKVVTDGEGRRLLLLPKGQTAPEGYSGLEVIETPVRDVMYDSTTQVGMLEALGDEAIYDSIKVVTTPASDWDIEPIVKELEEGTIQFLENNYETGLDIEQVQLAKPALVFSNLGDQTGVALRAKLEELGIPYVSDGANLETTEEGNLEWIKFFAAFYNLDAEADAFFKQSLETIDSLAEKAASAPEKPVVAEAMVFDGKVYINGGQSATAKKIERAGGIYAFAGIEGDGNMTITMEEFLDKAKDADILLYSSLIQYMPDKQTLLDTEPLLKEFKAVQEDQVWVLAKDFYMASAGLAEKFQDLVMILHPELKAAPELLHYEKLR